VMHIEKNGGLCFRTIPFSKDKRGVFCWKNFGVESSLLKCLLQPFGVQLDVSLDVRIIWYRNEFPQFLNGTFCFSVADLFQYSGCWLSRHGKDAEREGQQKYFSHMNLNVLILGADNGPHNTE